MTEQTTSPAKIKVKFPREFWLANFMELCERAVYYGFFRPCWIRFVRNVSHLRLSVIVFIYHSSRRFFYYVLPSQTKGVDLFIKFYQRFAISPRSYECC